MSLFNEKFGSAIAPWLMRKKVEKIKKLIGNEWKNSGTIGINFIEVTLSIPHNTNAEFLSNSTLRGGKMNTS